MKKLFTFFGIIIGLLIATTLFADVYTRNGLQVGFPIVFPSTGQIEYFATPTVTGNGDCSTWDNGCTFRTAVAKCTGTIMCEIYVGAGLHDLNNGSDANGTTIDKDYVHVHGLGDLDSIGQASTLMNSRAAGVDYILRVTGNKVTIANVVFDNTAQTDKNIIMLNMRGSYSTITQCLFRQNIGDGGGTGILADNGAVSMTISETRFRRVIDYGLNVNNFTRVYIDNTRFLQCGTGLYLSHANAGTIVTDHVEFYGNTTALNLATAVANTQYYIHTTLANNTTNFTDVASYGGAIWVEDVIESGIHRNVYPVDAAGVSVSKNANAYVWGTYNDIIAAGTFSKPARIQNIILEDWNAAQIFRIELFYGSASPGTISLGVYEFVAGNAGAGHFAIQLPVNIYIPARATIGAKLMSSTAAIDNVTISLGLELL